MASCKKCYKPLVTCGNCQGKGATKDGKACKICAGSGKLCPSSHGANHGN